MRNIYFLLNSTTQNFQNRLVSFHAKVFCFLEFVEKIWYIFTQCSISVAQMRYMFAVINSVKNTISTFSPENGSGGNYIETNLYLAMFGNISILEILWSGIFFTFSAISTVIPINKFLLIFLFLNYSRNFFWKSIKWRWVWNSISRQGLINNNNIYPGFKYEAKITTCETDYII